MAVISCPSCKGKLRFPDDSPPRRVKCPNCNHSFMAGANGPIADSSASSISKKKIDPPADSSASSIAKKKNPPPGGPRQDFEIVDEDDRPRSKNRVEADDDDRPRSKRRDRDDEDDDAPRSRRRDEDDDDRPRSKQRDRDEEDERPRSRRRGRDDDDFDDDDDRPRSRRRDRDDDHAAPRETSAQYRYARQGISLIAIGLWCQVGAFGAMLLVFLLAQMDVYAANLMALAGLPGITNWVLAVIGCSFLIAGPRKGNLFGLSIALVAVAAIHLVLVGIVSFDQDVGGKAYGTTRTSVNWGAMVTQFTALMGMIVWSHFEIVNLVAALLELAQFILLMLTLKEFARVCKNRDAGKHAMGMVILMPSGLGILLVLHLILVLIFKNANVGPSIRYVGYFLDFLQIAAYIAIFALAAVVTGGIKGSIYMRKR